MDHCGEFNCALWTTAANLVMHFGPLYVMKLVSNTITISMPWVMAQDLVMCYEPLCRIYYARAMGHSTGFCYVLWAIAKELVMSYGP